MDALTAQDSRIIHEVLAITIQHQVAVIESRPNKITVLTSLGLEVTTEETLAAIVVPDFTRTTVTGKVFHQIHMSVLAIHILLANIHTKELGQAPLGTME